MGGRVALRFFATAREAVGVPELRWDLPDPAPPVQDLLAEVSARYPRLRPVLRQSTCFLNGIVVRRPGVTRPRDGDEIAIHPPYSGG